MFQAEHQTNNIQEDLTDVLVPFPAQASQCQQHRETLISPATGSILSKVKPQSEHHEASVPACVFVNSLISKCVQQAVLCVSGIKVKFAVTEVTHLSCLKGTPACFSYH